MTNFASRWKSSSEPTHVCREKGRYYIRSNPHNVHWIPPQKTVTDLEDQRQTGGSRELSHHCSVSRDPYIILQQCIR